MKPDASFEFGAGRLICRHVRDILESEQFSGRNIRFRESSGWFFRTFTIVGEESDVDAVRSRLEHYSQILDEKHG